MLEIQVMDWDRHTDVAGSKPSPLDYWISNNYTDLNKQLLEAHKSLNPSLSKDQVTPGTYLHNTIDKTDIVYTLNHYVGKLNIVLKTFKKTKNIG